MNVVNMKLNKNEDGCDKVHEIIIVKSRDPSAATEQLLVLQKFRQPKLNSLVRPISRKQLSY